MVRNLVTNRVKEVPPAYREKWTRAFSSILRRVLAAQTEKESDKSLKLILIAVQSFFREEVRKVKSTSGLILLTQLAADKAALGGQQPSRKGKKRVGDSAVSAAKLGKSLNGVASMADPAVRATLQAKSE